MNKKLITKFLAMLLVLFALIPFGWTANAASNEVTRADYVKELVESLDVEIGDGSSLTFTDVSKDLAPYVEKSCTVKTYKRKNGNYIWSKR
ncbi:hypothetical protein OL548_02065 [Lysinibacillus sp. MHQ-1]|nr:hypothetical protein OL548_02065 [Lysinibacillus sp. MHQ-1]